MANGAQGHGQNELNSHFIETENGICVHTPKDGKSDGIFKSMGAGMMLMM